MNNPPFHLRQNKAIDRLLFFETIRALEKKHADLSQYTYYGLGGPYLEEFRLLYETFPEIQMVSIERKSWILKRQEFHLPCHNVKLERKDIRSFLTRYDPKGRKSIFWIDNTDLKLANIEDFQLLLARILAESIVKITLRAESKEFVKKPEKFREEFGSFLPDGVTDPPGSFPDFAKLVQDMLQISAEQILPATGRFGFQPIASFFYSDGTWMFTLTGIVYDREHKDGTRDIFRKLRFANMDWGKPRLIDVPILSTKERLFLQGYLPCRPNAGKRLHKLLGYSIDEQRAKAIAMLDQYEEFHRYFPYFMKAIP